MKIPIAEQVTAEDKSTSEKQARLMAAACHTPGGYGGVSKEVGCEFNQKDKGSKMLKRAAKDK